MFLSKTKQKNKSVLKLVEILQLKMLAYMETNKAKVIKGESLNIQRIHNLALPQLLFS